MDFEEIDFNKIKKIDYDKSIVLGYFDAEANFSNEEEFSVYSTYLFLKERFGEPSSFVDDSLAFFFQVDSEIYLSVWGGTSNGVFGKEVEVLEVTALSKDHYTFVYFYVWVRSNGSREYSEKIAKDFVQWVEKERSKFVSSGKYHNKITRKIKASQEKMVQNPCKIYLDAANTLLKSSPSNEAIMSSFLLYYSALEGFINLLYELYLAEIWRNDSQERKRLIQHTPITSKLRLAPAYCICFQNIDPKEISSSKIFQRFSEIPEIRNNYAHSNISSDMEFFFIEDDGYHFLASQENFHNSQLLNLPKNPQRLKIEHLRVVKSTIEELMEYVISLMTPLYQGEMSTILNDDFIIVNR